MFKPSDHGAELEEEEFRLLRDFIHERYGLYFDDSQRGSLRTRLGGRLQALDLHSFGEYCDYLRFSPDRDLEWRSMVDHLTNNETYFFREKPQLAVFSDPVLRTLRTAKQAGPQRTLSVLSAGCSTGEEAYTLAMLLWDSGQFFWNWEARVVGIDVDSAALERARTAVYFHNSFRSLAPALLEKHFVRQGGGHAVKEHARRLVELRRGNLLEPKSYAGHPFDVIFCRNVLIYFSDEAIQRAAEVFDTHLAPGGYLFLGHAESLSRVTTRFEAVRFPGALAYRKPVAQP